MFIECDRPFPEGDSVFNSVVVIKSCIVSIMLLNFEHVLNFPHTSLKNRVCPSCQKGEKLTPKISGRGKIDSRKRRNA